MFRHIVVNEEVDLGGEEATAELIQDHLRKRNGLEVDSIVSVWNPDKGVNKPPVSEVGRVKEFAFTPNYLIEVYMKSVEPEPSQIFLAVVKEA